jgi:hypothetical protein
VLLTKAGPPARFRCFGLSLLVPHPPRRGAFDENRSLAFCLRSAFPQTPAGLPVYSTRLPTPSLLSFSKRARLHESVSLRAPPNKHLGTALLKFQISKSAISCVPPSQFGFASCLISPLRPISPIFPFRIPRPGSKMISAWFGF